MVAGAIGGGVAEHLSSGGFEDPAAESTQAERVLDASFDAGDPTSSSWSPPRTAPSTTHGRRRRRALTARAGGRAGIDQAISYWSLGTPRPCAATTAARRSSWPDRRRRGRRSTTASRTSPPLHPATAPIDVSRSAATPRSSARSAPRRERPGQGRVGRLPITLLLLVLVFGSVVAAGAARWRSACWRSSARSSSCGCWPTFTEVSIFALNLTTAMGLGLAIDYSLFVVSRYREELRAGLAPGDAVVRTVSTAGRTVVFSAATVAASLAALLVFPLAFLRSFAYAGIAVVALAALGAVVVLPALLAVLGHRVDKWSLFRRQPKAVGEGFWHRVAMTVMRRPVGDRRRRGRPAPRARAAPFLDVELRPARRPGPARHRQQPPGAGRHPHQLHLQRGGALQVVAAGIGDPPTRRRDRRATPRTSPGCRARPGSTPSPAPTSTAPQVAAAQRGLGPVRRPTTAPGSRSSRGGAASADGEALVKRRPRPRRALPGRGGRPVGRAGRLQGVALRPAAAGRWASSPSSPSSSCS